MLTLIIVYFFFKITYTFLLQYKNYNHRATANNCAIDIKFTLASSFDFWPFISRFIQYNERLYDNELNINWASKSLEASNEYEWLK